MTSRKSPPRGCKNPPESAASPPESHEPPLRTVGSKKLKEDDHYDAGDDGLGTLKMMVMMIRALAAPPKGFHHKAFSQSARHPVPGKSPMVWWSRPLGQVILEVLRFHPIPCAFAVSLLFFMGVEYSLLMVSPSSPPYDLGFVFTHSLHLFLARRPSLNTILAALNTVFVGMQTAYILWALLVECRPRAAIAALFMFTCRGILGYATQLPLPKEFLGSGVDFPVGNVSFFLFFSGHVGGSVIASIDMRRMQRWELAWIFDALNFLQGLRLLATRGHYTIDLAVGVGAGFLCDALAGRYQEIKSTSSKDAWSPTATLQQQQLVPVVQQPLLVSKPHPSTL
ncbi:phosphatidylcholine:diacylglycerol cholinephosphotransferase 1-like [Nymphaea colorata]|nr:phosphatidylcholine:diacylglycerol cholinephosphotransferase 1-like [Nymphaea colorata]